MPFRCPTEVGGTYFSFSLFVTSGIGMLGALNYEGGEREVPRDAILTIMAGSYAFVFLLASIERKYVRTFFDTRTTASYIQDAFLVWKELETTAICVRYSRGTRGCRERS